MNSCKQSTIRSRYDRRVSGEIQIHDSIFRRVQHHTLLRPQITEYHGLILRLLNDVSYTGQVTLQEILKFSRIFQRLHGHSTLRTLVIPRYSLEFRRRIRVVSSVTLYMQHFVIGYLRLRPGRQRTVCISIPKISMQFFSSPNRPDRLWRPTSLPLHGNRKVFIVASPSSAEVKNAWSCSSIFAYAFKACVRTLPSSFFLHFITVCFCYITISHYISQLHRLRRMDGWPWMNREGCGRKRMRSTSKLPY
jgi:hypothetical protein